MLRRWLLFGALVLLAVLGSTFIVRGPASAASPFFQAAGRIDVEYFPQPTAAEERILRALDERVSLRFRNASINDLAEYLREVTGGNVYVDMSGLNDLGFKQSEESFTGEFGAIPLRKGLKLLLDEHELTYVLRDGVLWITSIEVSEEVLVTRVYPVSGLVAYGGTQDFDPLIELIENTLEVDSWDPVGVGTMQEFDATGMLVINQTRNVTRPGARAVARPAVLAPRELRGRFLQHTLGFGLLLPHRQPSGDAADDDALKQHVTSNVGATLPLPSVGRQAKPTNRPLRTS